MYKILLQAGHENITTGSTGAPEEKANNIRIRNRLGDLLIARGFVVTLCDANYSSSEDYSLALAMHCDANYAGDEGGGFVDYPDPSIDMASAESKRIKEAIESEYFKHSGIRNMPNRSNPNTKFYYWWKMLSEKTPCVIIEMGESVDPHDRVLLADTDRIANAIARGICKAFNVAFDTAAPNSCIANWEKLCQYLGITNDPTTTTFEDVQRVIAGIRSRATDMEKQASYWETECKNRTEQVSRLKGDIASLSNEKNLLQEQYNKIVSEVQKMASLYKGQLDAKQGVIDEKCRQIGDLNHQIAELQAKQEYETIATIDFAKSKYKVIKLK